MATNDRLEFNGQSLDDILEDQDSYSSDNVVVVIMDAIWKKKERVGALGMTHAEFIFEVIYFVDYWIGNDGFEELFWHHQRDYAPFMVDSLKTIGCRKTARIAQEALDVLGIQGRITANAVSDALADGGARSAALRRCDDALSKVGDAEMDLSTCLLKFVNANRSAFLLEDVSAAVTE